MKVIFISAAVLRELKRSGIRSIGSKCATMGAVINDVSIIRGGGGLSPMLTFAE